MADFYPSIAQCAVVATAFKVLLFPAYLPVKEWYFEKTSQWTLDYPPFFAGFEWILSQFARLADPEMLKVYNLEYDSWQTIYFQRASVIITELVLVYALHLFAQTAPQAVKRPSHAAALSILLSPGLLIIDHIHFQYNGFLYGLLILSLVLARKQSTTLASGLIFAVLLCLKHIYLYLAPAYFVFLLRAYCLGPKSIFHIRFGNALKLGAGIIAIFGVAFGPFAYWGQIPQLLSRLFPFSRGLCHAYWAPNIWAMYSFTDRILIYVAPRLGLAVNQDAVNSVTRGLVGDTSFAVLPEITARTTFILTLFFQAIPLIKLFFDPAWDTFIGAVTLCGYASFLFGWHVHEKAILLVIIPFSLIALKDRRYLGAFRPLAVAGHVSLFPLLFTAAEFPIKTIYTIFWLVLFLLAFDRLAPASNRSRIFLLDRFSLLYITVSIPLILYCSLLHRMFFGKSFEFLPLMFTTPPESTPRDLAYARLTPGLLDLDVENDARAAEAYSACETAAIDLSFPCNSHFQSTCQNLFDKTSSSYASLLVTTSPTLPSTHPSPPLHATSQYDLWDLRRVEDCIGSSTRQASGPRQIHTMVLFKRKPVQYAEKPYIESDDTEVWLIPQTGEVFVDYEAYLARMDFYKQRRFICQITGHSGLSFFEALKSELAGAQEVDEAFPEALKGPILRRVQFQTISRIDTLVDLIYEEYRSDYYPGEAVTVHVVTGERLSGIVRDKTRFGPKVMPDGTSFPAFSRYFVSLDNRPTEEAVVDDAHITRDRKIFTKQVLRSFIKKTVTREAWTGAPWLVNHDVAAEYHIDTRVPPHLRYESKAAERKQNQAQKKFGPDFEGMLGSFQGNGQGHSQGHSQGHGQGRLPELKPAPKSHKSKQQQGGLKSKLQPFLNPAPSNPFPPPLAPQFISHTFQAHSPPHVGPHHANFHNGGFALTPLAPLPPAPPPPPPVKYPIEDLQLAPRLHGPKRPQMKYFSQDTPVPVDKPATEGNGILMKSVGALLECWDTLNVYCEIFKLDSFTFDDFVEAMQFSSEDVECELFVETHCAALKLLVNSEADGGKVQVQLPELDEDTDEDEEDEASAEPSPEPEPEVKPKGRATRSSLAKAELEAKKAEIEAELEPESTESRITHRAAEMQAEMNWIERLQKRDFKNGGWEITMIGLLHQLSKNPRHFNSCEALLQQLAPLDMEPTQETARKRYAKLDVNLRIQALQIVCMLTAETKAIRGYMEECSEQMTAFRKEKIQWQREKKQYAEELRVLLEERKTLLPPSLPSPPTEMPNGDTKTTGVEEKENSLGDETIDTDEDPHPGRSLRHGNDRAAERKRKRDARQEKKAKAQAEAKLPKQSKQVTKLLKDIAKKQDKIKNCEDEIATLDNDLREADCPRTRVLGKDRFWNRYYWFERNGMPYAGLPNSSTADAGYANGCIWIQGPDDMEREGYIEMKPEWQHEYMCKFNMTVPQRKILEEGGTNVFNARQWGYYDEPAQLDGLINWLDGKGFNEAKLNKELQLYRDRIIQNMEKRKEYLNPTEEKSPDLRKRMATRGKQIDAEHKTYRCLAWHNTTAIRQDGNLHSNEPRTRKPAKKSAAATVGVEEERQTRSEAKSKEKPLGRQGSRYNF
ncbi:hypothetical protein B7494_g8256 [Chlorociboria aeruginascens]|nr:hypothetical protein B7494_g8256 [Chlorociboria aeruginascens]